MIATKLHTGVRSNKDMKLFPNIETHTTTVNKALFGRCEMYKVRTNGGVVVAYVRTLIFTESVYPPDIIRIQT